MEFRNLIFSLNKKILLKLSQVILLIWLCGFIWFINEVKNFTYYEYNNAITDAIVVLTGGKERIAEGIKLLANHHAKKILISGVWREVYINQIKEIDMAKKLTNDLKNKITLGRFAENTLENAVETDMWMDLNYYHSIRVVTADYHMPRTKLIFDMILKNKKIIYHPITGANFKIGKWWDFPGTTKLVFIEYNKYILQNILNLIWYEYD